MLVGVRSIDAGEREHLTSSGVTVFTMYDVDRHGMHHVMEHAIRIASGAAFMHVSFDMDVVDPDQAPGVGTPVRGGITYREAHLVMEMLASRNLITLARAGRGEPGARRAQRHRRPGRRAGLLGVRQAHPLDAIEGPGTFIT